MERKHLVYVLPGIGGSVLERPKSGGGFSTVWDAGFGDIGDLLARPGRMSVEDQEHLRPVGLIASKRLLPGWPVVHGYDRLARRLCALPGVRLDTGHPDGRVPGANVVLFPYDFRRSVVEAAERLDADVRMRLEALGGDPVDRVVVIAHSLGGLVARYWMGPLQGWRVSRALITLGTPHRGSPKALDVVANGVPIRTGRLHRPARMLAGWASVGELLPAYKAVWDVAGGALRYPHELPVDQVRALAGSGYAVHQAIVDAWGRQVPRQGPEMRAYFGFSHETSRSAVWDQDGLRVVSQSPPGMTLTGWEQDLGDGTVPAFCAVPVEVGGNDVRELRVPDKHGPLGASRLIPGLLEFYEGRVNPRFAQGAEEKVPGTLGLDVDDLHPAGDHVPVQVRIVGSGEPGQADSASMWVKVCHADRQDAEPALAQVRAVWDSAAGVFGCELPGLAPGLYDVVAEAQAVPGIGDLACTDTIAVVEP